MKEENTFTADLSELLSSRAPGTSIWVSKADQSELPTDWSKTLLGTPLWIAKPGSTAQYRSGALHAYEFEDGFEVHQDRFDPHENPAGHFFLDAPELPLATAAAGLAGYFTYRHFERREAAKDEPDRQWWLPALAAAGVALVVWIAVYLLGAMVRVALTGG